MFKRLVHFKKTYHEESCTFIFISTKAWTILPQVLKGWLEKFMRTHGLSSRRRTTCTVALNDPEQLTEKLVAYVLQPRRLARLFGYQPFNISIAIDETDVWLDLM